MSRKPGRPTVKTDATRKAMLAAAAAGYASLASIARAVGIHPDTLRTWCNEDDSLEPELRAAIEARLDKIEAGVLAQAETDPRIGLAILKTRRPEGYDSAHKVEVTGADGGPLAVAVSRVAGMSDEDLAAALARLEAAVAGEG